MQQWYIKEDRLYSAGEVDYLGVPYHKIENKEVGTLPEDYDGWFPFMRCCYSLGDLGITSGIFEALKIKYPKMKIAFASPEYTDHIFGPGWASQWDYDKSTTGFSNIETIMANNPHIDRAFGPGEFDSIFTDHDRSYTSLIHDGEMIRSCDEPLAEQILRRFGFTDKDLTDIPSTPKLYFTPEEIKSSEAIIEQYVGSKEYGCILLASRLERFKSREWEGEEYLFEYLEKYKNKPVFLYTDRDLTGTKWNEYFPDQYHFDKLGITLRQQLYIKQKALFNTGYQAGVTDVCLGNGTDAIILCPYKSIRENCIRGTRYVYSDGSTKVI